MRSDVGHRAGFQNDVTRKHFVTSQEDANVRMKVKDLTVTWNQEEVVSVGTFVNELQKERPNVKRGLDSWTDGLAHNVGITVLGPPTTMRQWSMMGVVA